MSREEPSKFQQGNERTGATLFQREAGAAVSARSGEERLRADLISVYQNVKGGCRGIARLRSALLSNEQRAETGAQKLHLNMMVNFCTVPVTEHRNRLPGEAVGYPSLEILKNCAMCSRTPLPEQRARTRDPRAPCQPGPSCDSQSPCGGTAARRHRAPEAPPRHLPRFPPLPFPRPGPSSASRHDPSLPAPPDCGSANPAGAAGAARQSERSTAPASRPRRGGAPMTREETNPH